MFESLSERLERSFKILKGEGKITEINIAETLKDVRRALTDGDVQYNVASNFIKNVKKKALGQNVINALKPKELMIKIVHDELVELMGSEVVPLNIDGKPAVILMAGLQGAGKTTFAGKLAKRLKATRGKHPLLVGADVYRPAAREQLRILAESIDVPLYTEEDSKDPVAIALHAIEHARQNKNDVVIIDTAGRLAVDDAMMDEIANIKKAVNPQETLFVVDSMTGQDAVNTAKAFNDRLGFDGVVLTKLDGDTRGGAAISIRAVVDKPIKLVGVGEKMEDIQDFNPKGMADRILGMGDVVELTTRIMQAYDEDQARQLEQKMKKNEFDFNDFLSQINQIKKMGSLKSLAAMIPGVGKAIKDIDIDDNAFKGIEAIIGSMTPAERSHPDIIDMSRRRRIAKGSGTKIEEVTRLIKQFSDMRKMMQKVTNNKNPMKMMNQLKQMQRGGGGQFRR